jgi:hypothetical protein
MPQGTYTTFHTVYRTGTGCSGGADDGATHAFWRGTLEGHNVALQGGNDLGEVTSRYDIFEETGSTIQYWGTFRGNDYTSDGSNYGNSFNSPYTFMNNDMTADGSPSSMTSGSVTDNHLDSHLRRDTSTGPLSFSVAVNAHYASWSDPDSGTPWNDVLKITFTVGGRPEVYYLANGKGTVRFESGDPNEPSCVSKQYVIAVGNYSPNEPIRPWYDPFKNTTFVSNGFFEDTLTTPSNGAGPIDSYERSWSGSAGHGTPTVYDVVVSNDAGDPGAGPWKVALRGSTGGGDTVADVALSASIPVTPNATYRLSGWLWRVSSNDNVYLDFNDIPTDIAVLASSTNTWEFVQGQTTVGSATTIQVRCVRDGANEGNAYCDGITLQRVD